MSHDVLIVFLKEPRPGAVKTRLGREIGADLAARVYRALAELEVARTAPRRGAYERLFLFSPAVAVAALASWFPGETLVPQVEGDLGARMSAAFAETFARGARRACIIGTDVPWVDEGVVEEALQSLDDHDLVLGPAHDGGYYLLALAQDRPELFQGVAWSTPSVLSSTVERAGRLGLSLRLLSVLPDIDTAADIRAYWSRLAPLLPPALTRELVTSLGLRVG